MKNINSTWIIAISISFSVLIIVGFNFIKLGAPYILHKKQNISVKGSVSIDFTSDYIVWNGQFYNKDLDLTKSYELMKRDKEKISDFFTSNKINDSLVTFKSIQMKKVYKKDYKYNGDGEIVNSEDVFDGYMLSQDIIIESNDVALVERVANEITDLIAFNVNISSMNPRYYYTKLSDLKIDMIKKAGEDGLLRAKTAVSSSGGSLGSLLLADIGVFQILGKNSNDNFSWGGTLNLLSKEKTAYVTVKQKYSIK